MKLRLDYTKQGSEEVIEKLAVYVENWRARKRRIQMNTDPRSNPPPRRNTHRVTSEERPQRPPQQRNGQVTRRTNPLPHNERPAQHNNRNTYQRQERSARVSAEPDIRRRPAPEGISRTRPVRQAQRQRPPVKDKMDVKKVFSRIGISVLTFLLAIVLLALSADLIVLHGPSKAARDRFVLTVTETSAAKFLANWFLSDETVKSIIEGNAVVGNDDTTDTTLIKLPGSDNNQNPEDDPKTDINSVQLINIEGKTYRGKLLIVQNPKRVYLGTPAAYGSDKEGISTIDIVKQTNALYGVNGGGFYDTGKGNGGVPTGRENSDGIVISKGNLMWGERNREYEIIGINKKGIMVLGKMTAQAALDSGIVEALNFGPYLVMNGKACEVGGFTEAGLNPRTAIGQRSDGAMLILTIDGRQPSSMGASYEDLIEVMMNYGAVNAANLDGGSSTYMAQNAETENNPQIITQCASLYGPRKMATSILVSRVDQINSQYEQ